MDTRIVITAVHVPGDGCYCPACFLDSRTEVLDSLIKQLLRLDTWLDPEGRIAVARLRELCRGNLEGIRSLWTQNGLSETDTRILGELGLHAYDPRFPAQPMTGSELQLWQLACHECPRGGEVKLPPGTAVLIPGNQTMPRIAGSMMSCRACTTWKARLAECVVCGRILV